MTSDRPSGPLLAVKLGVPPVRPGAVGRPRLEQLLRGIDTRLTVVAAPAGWGKTSLLSRWAADPGPGVSVAWVSLDEGDDEPVRFWRYVFTALQSTGAIGPAAPEAVVAPGAEPLELALPILLNELSVSGRSDVLVLDDYHVLADPRIHEALEYLLSYLPPSLRLVISTRADPPLPLARLRARGELTELRAADLRFSRTEATALLGAVAGHEPGDPATAAAWRRTEGWAAGLQLVGLGLRNPSRDGAGDRHVLDYLAAEVLPALEPAERDLLVASAPFERLSGALCDAVLATTGSSRVLEALDRADLFVTPLDEGREWYRCHPLFREVLLRESPSEPAVLARAAAWFATQGRLDDAAHHHLLAGAPGAAAELLETHAMWFLDRGLVTTFLRLGERLPDADLTPQLAFTLAYAAFANGDQAGATRWLDAGERRVGPDDTVTGWHDARAATLNMRAVVAVPEATPEPALRLLEEALSIESASRSGASAQTRMSLASTLARAGRFEQAAPGLLEAWRQRDTVVTWPLNLKLQIGGLLGFTMLELGRDDDAERLLRQAAPLVEVGRRNWGAAAPPVLAPLRVVEGRLAYRRGDALRARDLLESAAADAEAPGRHLVVVSALVSLAEAELACGNRAAAHTALARAREFVEDNVPVAEVALAWLERAEARIGRSSVAAAKRSGTLIEPLTDREMSILRAMQGSASQREIGAALYLSINTVKAYTKSLYRKLGVGSRAEAVTAARSLGLI